MKIFTVLTECGKTGKTIADDLGVGDYGMIEYRDENGNLIKVLATVKEVLESKELWQ